MKAVTLEDWKGKMLDKGVNRVASGIDAAAPKVIAFATQLLPHIDALVSQVNKMPDATLEDSIARATFMMRGMAKFVRA
jgi:hypothetical protein